jgi:MSHA biogenesis protein MshP
MSAVQPMAGKTRGFALMMAVFLIVTLAAVGVYLLTISTGQLEAATQDEQGARAYQAARTGIEWGAYRAAKGATCAGITQFLPLQQGFSVQVSCTSATTETEGVNPVEVFQITTTGCNSSTCPLPLAAPGPPGPTYVERQLHLTLTR